MKPTLNIMYNKLGKKVDEGSQNMPFINSKISITISKEQETKLKTELGKAIELIPGKSENWLMTGFEDGYHLYLMQHKYPYCILMLDVDPSVVDVNVHPTKMDVLFEEPSEIYDFVSQSIARRLKENDMMPPVYLTEQEKSSPDPASAPEPFQRAAAAKVREQESRIVMPPTVRSPEMTRNAPAIATSA